MRRNNQEEPYIPRDFATVERRAFIGSVSPFIYASERRAAVLYYMLALVFGYGLKESAA